MKSSDGGSLAPHLPIEELHQAIERYINIRAVALNRPVPLIGDWAVSIEALVDTDGGDIVDTLAVVTVIRQRTTAADAKKILAMSALAMHERDQEGEEV